MSMAYICKMYNRFFKFILMTTAQAYSFLNIFLLFILSVDSLISNHTFSIRKRSEIQS